MYGELKNEDVERARRDLGRTLRRLDGDFARLVYLASTRDYNTGQYHHDGLAFMFNEDVAARAIENCHQEVFRRLVGCSMNRLVEQLELYASSHCSTPCELVRIWEKLQPYRSTIPFECSPLAARFFISNVRAALAVVQSRQLRAPQEPLSALPAP